LSYGGDFTKIRRRFLLLKKPYQNETVKYYLFPPNEKTPKYLRGEFPPIHFFHSGLRWKK